MVIDGRLIGLKRAFNNLVGNAVRFGSKVTVTATLNDHSVVVMVEDDGPGIPEEQLAAVLEPFIRLDHSRNRETGGVGLGLTIAKNHIEADGGTLSLSNRLQANIFLANISLANSPVVNSPLVSRSSGGLCVTTTLPLRRL
jgi:two-component system, OmpR family, sensor kinase